MSPYGPPFKEDGVRRYPYTRIRKVQIQHSISPCKPNRLEGKGQTESARGNLPREWELRLRPWETLSTNRLTLTGVASGYYSYSDSRESATSPYIRRTLRSTDGQGDASRKIYLMQGLLWLCLARAVINKPENFISTVHIGAIPTAMEQSKALARH